MLTKEEGIFKRELALCYDAEQDTDAAVKVLASITYENGDEQIIEKVDDYLTLAEWWFAKDDSTNTETWVNKASHLIYNEGIKVEH